MAYKIRKQKKSAINVLALDWKQAQKIRVDRNKKLFDENMAEYNKEKGIRVGDYIEMPSGKITRVTYIWRDEKNKQFQIQTGGDVNGSYYLGKGYADYSGSLDSGYKVEDTKFTPTKKKKLGNVWVFDNDIAQAGGGVDKQVPFRVFKANKEAE